MAQPGKIEFSFWYSLAKWHRTVDRQPAAMRTCLKTAGKGNSTYCLQTWTHMSENAQNIAFFTRFVGAESAGLSKKGVKTESKQGPKKSPKKIKQTVERNRKRVKHQSKLLHNASGILRYLVSLIWNSFWLCCLLGFWHVFWFFWFAFSQLIVLTTMFLTFCLILFDFVFGFVSFNNYVFDYVLIFFDIFFLQYQLCVEVVVS